MFSVDLFAGGGGASQGIQMATGRSPFVAINHNQLAIAMHTLNHPDTIHYHEDVFAVNPRAAVGSRPVDLLWASPDCTHFSRSKGGKPKDKHIRGLAWVVVKWAEQVRPRLICMENVAEFLTWGPLYPDDYPIVELRNHPIKELAGTTFRLFIERLRHLGYEVQWRVLVAANYGAPTSRKRLYIIARRDGLPIAWPEPTHGPGRVHPWRTAAECIDWHEPMLSIFATQEEARVWAKAVGADGVPKRPLATATLRRLATGFVRYVVEAADPFLLNLTHGRRLEPLREPMRTITAAHRGEKALVRPYLLQTGHQTGDGGKTRDVRDPLSTIVTKAEHCLVAPMLAPGTTDNPVMSVDAPLKTITTGMHHALIAAFLTKHYGGPRPSGGQACDRPLGTVTGVDHHSVAAVYLDKAYGSTRAGQDVRLPMATVTDGGQHISLVAAFLLQFYSNGGQWQDLREPLRTVVGKARFGLVTVEICGVELVVADLTMRMLRPRELARAQGFDDSYRLVGSKAEQISKIGNSVVPQMACALVRANTWYH